MAAINGHDSRAELKQQSLQVGGFTVEKRRRAWLQLLDLQHLEPQLVASTLQLHEPSQTSPSFKQSPSISLSTSNDNAVALDGEGWQIPHLSHLDVFQDDAEEQEWESQEWSVATSKRHRRKKKAAESNATSMTRSNTTTTFATTSPDESRNDSMEDLASNGGLGATETGPVESSRLTLKEERKRRKKEKKKLKQQPYTNGSGGGLEASGILMPSSEVLKDEDWVKAEDSRRREHRDESQVALDINRSFIGGKWKGDEQRLRREQLSRVIVGVLRRHDNLNYYQGYHDIISILLIVLVPDAEGIADMDKALEIVVEVSSRVSLHLLRDNMTVNMEPSMGHLKIMRNLLREVDYATSVEVEAASSLPYFALPWLISLFAHELDYNLSVAVFDYILARSPSSVIYLAVALILHAKTDSSKEDAAEKHHSLSQLPRHVTPESLPLIMQRADSLSEEHSLDVKSIMGSRSVLVTWNQLPISSSKSPDGSIATPWPHADALAEAILSGGTEQIVVDSLPTPPASDDGYAEEKYDKKRHKKAKHSGASSLLAVVGAVGAVGVAALLMYGAGKSGMAF